MKKQTHTWEDFKGEHHPLLESFLTVAPFINSLFVEDVSMGVADTEKYLLSTDGDTIRLHIDYGVPLQEGDAITLAIRKKQMVRLVVPEEVFGFPMIATAIPLFGENNKVIGGIGLGVNMMQYNKLFTIASNLSVAVQQVTSALINLADSTGTLATNMEEISKQSTDVLENIELIKKFSESVKQISEHSHILGMNASIEAARVGETGRGFAVVADEMRKMAATSKEHTIQIQKTVKNINELIHILDLSISEVNRSTENQSTVTEELSSAMQSINTSAAMLTDLAEQTLNEKIKYS